MRRVTQFHRFAVRLRTPGAMAAAVLPLVLGLVTPGLGQSPPTTAPTATQPTSKPAPPSMPDLSTFEFRTTDSGLKVCDLAPGEGDDVTENGTQMAAFACHTLVEGLHNTGASILRHLHVVKRWRGRPVGSRTCEVTAQKDLADSLKTQLRQKNLGDTLPNTERMRVLGIAFQTV